MYQIVPTRKMALPAYDLSKDAWAIQGWSDILQAPLRRHKPSNGLANDHAGRSRLFERLKTYRLSKLFTNSNEPTLQCFIPAAQTLNECGCQHLVRYPAKENDDINRLVDVISKFCHFLRHKPPQDLDDLG